MFPQVIGSNQLKTTLEILGSLKGFWSRKRVQSFKVILRSFLLLFRPFSKPSGNKNL